MRTCSAIRLQLTHHVRRLRNIIRITGPVALIYSGPPLNLPWGGRLSSPLSVSAPGPAPLGSYTATVVLLRASDPDVE